MKTKLEILEGFHDQALTKLLETKINLSSAEKRSIVLKPGKEYDEVQKSIVKFKEMKKTFESVVSTIDEFIAEAKKE